MAYTIAFSAQSLMTNRRLTIKTKSSDLKYVIIKDI